MRGRSTGVAAALLVALGARAPAQDAAAPVALERALAAEARQVALIERLSPSVAAVFQGETPGQGGGSGVIIDPAGYVLTNFHVSGLSRVLTVGLDDGRTYRAFLLGIDPGGDIALLKLEGRDAFPAVPLGRSDLLLPGERVFAMGNPFLLAEDYSPTVTEGIVSGVHRYRDATGGSDLVYGDSIQIDASINPGNSGGPLFDARGRLVGINGLGGFRPDRGRVNVGVGFAASIDQIQSFLLDLRAGRQCQHGTLNATVRDVEGEDGRAGKVVVNALMRESNAARAGLRLGDEVRRCDGRPVQTQNELLTFVSRLPAGRRVTLSVARPREDGQGFHELDVTFRLEPLWSGPEQGEWNPDDRLVREELQALLAGYRRAGPPVAWAREEVVSRPGGGREPRLVRVSGRRIRVESGPPGRRTIEVVDAEAGRGLAIGADGAVTQLAPERRDLLAGTVEALWALATPGAEAGLSGLQFTGGELLAGRQVARLEVRDRAGRRRLVYVDPDRHTLTGLAYPAPDGSWVEEAHLAPADGAPARIVSVGHEDGKPLEEARVTSFQAGPQDPALFDLDALGGEPR